MISPKRFSSGTSDGDGHPVSALRSGCRPHPVAINALLHHSLTDDQLEVVHGDLHVVGLNESVGPFMMRDSGSVKLYCAFGSGFGESSRLPAVATSSLARCSNARFASRIRFNRLSRTRRCEDDRHVEPAARRREPCVAATAATRGLFVAADDESFAGVRRRDVVGGSDGGS